MMHVKQIQEIIDEGRSEEAFDALEQLLCLGPSNTEALKLKAMLYRQQGRFAEEFKAWTQIIEIDNEDMDAISFFQEKHVEEKENYYFVDDLPNGGRRYMAYPRALLMTTMYALGGCLLFLAYSKLAQKVIVLETPIYLLSVFGLLVLVPWGVTVSAWVRSLKCIRMDKDSIEFATRFHVNRVLWKDVEKAWLASTVTEQGEQLHLVLMPKDGVEEEKVIEIDLSSKTSSIKAKSFFLKDVYCFLGNYDYIPKEKIDFKGKKIKTF